MDEKSKQCYGVGFGYQDRGRIPIRKPEYGEIWKKKKSDYQGSEIRSAMSLTS